MDVRTKWRENEKERINKADKNWPQLKDRSEIPGMPLNTIVTSATKGNGILSFSNHTW
jgi:hypothetical protein